MYPGKCVFSEEKHFFSKENSQGKKNFLEKKIESVFFSKER